MSTAILELQNLNKTFKQDLLKRSHHALKDVSCSFEKGKGTAILGHNGAGKTTTLRTVLGLLHPDSGEILFEGKPIVTEDRRQIGYMPETNKLPGELRSEELLYFHLNLYKPEMKRQEKDQRVEEKLEEVGLLKKHRRAKIHQLSKGLGRRLAWAMASIHQPRLLILDEPFTGMDPLGRNELSEWISSTLKTGRSVLMTTHDLKSAKELCSKMVIFREGEVAYQGDSTLAEEDVLNFFKGVL
jgi:ABC-2 type transport system ATP-binding protein